MRRGGRVALWLALAAVLAVPSSWVSAAPSSNDDFAQATPIPTPPFSDVVSDVEASLEPGEPKPSCAHATASVWYRFAFTEATTLRLQTSSSDHDTAVTIYRGDDLTSLTESACNDEFIQLFGGPARILFTAQAGVTYHVQVAAVLGSVGTIRFSVEETTSPPTLGSVERFEVTAGDGTILKGHVYLPAGEGPFATVLELSTYWNTNYIASDDAHREQEDRTTLWAHLGPYFDAGFAVALVNMRGSGLSRGCLQWGNELDQSDAAAVVERLAARPWSDGNVGMIGLSLSGWSPYLAIAGEAPHLRAVVPASGVIDLWSLVTRNGAALITGPALFPYHEGYVVRGLGGNANASLLFGGRPFVPQNSADQLACPEYAEHAIAGLETYTSGDRTRFWDERDLREKIRGRDVAVFTANGLNANGEGHVLQVEGLWDLMSPERRLLLGQWGHGYPTRHDFADLAVGWMDRYLRGGSSGPEPGIVEYQDTSGAWHTTDRWPPAAQGTNVWLSDRSLVASDAVVQASTQTFQSADLDPGPAWCPDRAVFVSPPLAEDVLLAGNAHIEFTLSSTLPDGNFSAFLWHTDQVPACPDAAADELDRANRGYNSGPPFANEVTRALTDLRHRDMNGYGAPMPVNAPTSIRIDSHPFAARVPAGERLVLTIGGGSAQLQPDLLKPLLTIWTGVGALGRIVIPVVEGTLRFTS